MKLLIFGATGGTGLALVSQALDEGHSVTAFARNPQAMPIQHANLQIVQGDVLDYDSVMLAVKGQEVVFSVLGVASFKKNTIVSDGTQNIIKAMQEHQAKRFICVTTMGLGETRNQKGWTFMVPISFMLRLQRLPLLRNNFMDREVQEKYVTNSALDWTIIRPGGLINGPRTGEYRHGFSIDDGTIKARISRADLADFLLKQIADDTYLHKLPSVSY